MFAVLEEDAPPPPAGDAAQARLGDIAERGRGIASQVAQLQAQLVDLAAEVETLGGYILDMSPQAFGCWSWGLDPKEAGRVFWLAKRLPKLGAIADAFADGKLSEGTVASMTAVATPENEDRLLEVAEVATGAQLRTLVRDFRRACTRDGEVQRDEYLRSGVDPDGMLSGSFRLSSLNGSQFQAAMRAAREAAQDDLDAAAAAAPEANPQRASKNPRGLRAGELDGFVGIIDSYLNATTDPSGVVPDRFRSIIVINLDDDVTDPGGEGSTGAEVVDETFSSTSGEPTGEPSGDLSGDDDTYLDIDAPDGDDEAPDTPAPDTPAIDTPGLDGLGLEELGVVGVAPRPAAVRAYLRGFGGIDLAEIAPLICTCDISVILKRHGSAVTVTSPTRLATKRQLLALIERDKTCTYPGCDRQFYLVAHHVRHSDHGGPTHIYNLVLLCKHHHQVVHRRGWRVEITNRGLTKRFYRPDGTEVLQVNPRPARGDPTLAPLPQPGEHWYGTGDRLTYYGRDVIVEDWQNHTNPN